MSTHAHIGARGTYAQRETEEMKETPTETNALECHDLMPSGNTNNLQLHYNTFVFIDCFYNRKSCGKRVNILYVA